MNLSPDWTSTLRGAGHDAVHWSEVGRVNAPDDEILRWARDQGRMVLTCDLDFGTMLATSGAMAPSVVQLRTTSTMSSRVGPLVLRVLRDAEDKLSSGALITIADDRVRLRPFLFSVGS